MMSIFVVSAYAGPTYWEEEAFFGLNLRQAFIYGNIVNLTVSCFSTILTWRKVESASKVRPIVLISTFLAVILVAISQNMELVTNHLVLFLLTTGLSSVKIITQEKFRQRLTAVLTKVYNRENFSTAYFVISRNEFQD